MFEQDELGYQRLSPGDPVCPAPASSARHGFAIYALCCVDSKVVTEYTTSNHSQSLFILPIPCQLLASLRFLTQQ